MNRNLSSIVGFGSTLATALLGAAIMTTEARAEGPIGQNDPFTSTRSRAEVQAELMGNRQQLSSFATEWNQQRNQPVQLAGGPTRAQVQADYIAARAQVQTLYAEHGGSGYFAQAPVRMPHLLVARRAPGTTAR